MLLYKPIVAIVRKQFAPTVQTRNVKSKVAIRRNASKILAGKMLEPINLVQNVLSTESEFSSL